MKKRLFVTDLDGTLLNTKKEIPLFTAQSIQKIVENEFERQYSILDETEKGIIDSYQIREKIYALVEQLDNARQIRRIIREAFSAALIRELL